MLNRYRTLSSECAAADARLTRAFNIVASLRAGAFILAALLAWFGATRHTPPLEWALVPFLFFLLLMFRHEVIVQERDRVRRTAAYARRGLARLEDKWAGTGNTGERFRNESHVYADDLDLFGKGSLFELLCTAETPSGQETLAGWLLAPARLDLAVLGVEVAGTVRGESLHAWGSAPPVAFPFWAAPVAFLLGLVNAGTLIAATWFDLTPWAPVISIATGMAVAVILRDRVRQITAQAERPARELDQLVILLGRLEREEWQSSLLRELAERHRATHTMLVPVQYQRLMAWPDFDQHDLSSFQFKACTSAQFRAELKAEVLRRWPGALTEYYGLTEGGGSCILYCHLFPHIL